jgi:5-methylcytosine-specific restriction endonuclease McrA
MQGELFATGISKQGYRGYQTERFFPDSKCLICGATFTPEAGHQRYCNPPKKCRQIAQRKGESDRAVLSNCTWCGKKFLPKRYYRKSLCSECYAAGIRLKPWIDNKPSYRKRLARALRNPIVQLCAVLGKIGQCEICGKKSFYVLCSRECALENGRRRSFEWSKAKYAEQNKSYKCKECGILCTPEYGTMRRTFCSIFCCEKYVRRTSKGMRRARMYAVEYEGVDPMLVFMRDGWKCQICKIKTPRSLRGTYSDRAPELDHIIPLARGGSHTYKNTQCLCRRCNQKKSTAIVGQLRMGW